MLRRKEVSFDYLDDPVLMEEKYLNGPITPTDFLDQITPIDYKRKSKRVDSLEPLGSTNKISVKNIDRISKEGLLEIFESEMTTIEIMEQLTITWTSLKKLISYYDIEKEYEQRKNIRKRNRKINKK